MYCNISRRNFDDADEVPKLAVFFSCAEKTQKAIVVNVMSLTCTPRLFLTLYCVDGPIDEWLYKLVQADTCSAQFRQRGLVGVRCRPNLADVFIVSRTGCEDMPTYTQLKLFWKTKNEGVANWWLIGGCYREEGQISGLWVIGKSVEVQFVDWRERTGGL